MTQSIHTPTIVQILAYITSNISKSFIINVYNMMSSYQL